MSSNNLGVISNLYEIVDITCRHRGLKLSRIKMIRIAAKAYLAGTDKDKQIKIMCEGIKNASIPGN